MEIGFLQETKAIIKSLVLSCPDSISIDKLNRDFRETEGHPIPYGKLGFKNLEVFLRSISDTVMVHGHGNMATLHCVANQKSDHIHDMIRSQKKTRRPRARNANRPHRYLCNRTEDTTNCSSNFRLGTNTDFRKDNRRINKCGFQEVPRRCFPAKDNYNKNQLNDVKNNAKNSQTPVFNSKQHSLVNTTMRKSLLPIELNSSENKKHKFLGKEKGRDSVHRETIPAELTEDPVLQITNKLKDLVRFQDHNLHDKSSHILQDNKNNYPRLQDMAARELPVDKSVSRSESRCMSNNTQKFPACSILDHPESPGTLYNSQKINVGENHTQKSSANEKADDSQMYVRSPKKINGSYKINNIAINKKPDFFEISESSKDIYDDLDEAVPKFAANNLVFRVDFPENTVMFGQKIKSYSLPPDLKKGAIIGIFVSEIHNPYKFWFHIHKEHHELDFLMHNIERFYNSLDSDEFVIPSTCHSPGQICAALYHKMWHRAEIIGQPINDKTKVFFLDYGTVSDVSVDDIKYLASMFATVPAQAIRGSLSHIKPRGLHWSHDATKYFLSLVCELLLYGQVAEIDEKDKILHLVICNTNGPEVTQVNKMLVENKFALYDEEWQEERITKNGFRWHHLREDFPTFEMLERGEYPSLSEVVDLLNRGIDYEKIIDRKIFHHGKMNNHENAPESLRNLPFVLLNTNPFRCDIILELHRSIKVI